MSLLSFLKKPSILLFGGFLGFVVTNVITAKATYNFIKAKEAMDHDTTLKEDIALGAKCYAGAITMGAVSAGLIFGGNKAYATTQASLVTGYTLLNTKYKNYRDAALKTLGLDKFKEIDTKVIEYNHKKNIKLIDGNKKVHTTEGMVLVVDPFSDPDNPVYSEITPEQLSDARYYYNKMLCDKNVVSVNDYRELLSMNTDLKGEDYGYTSDYIYDQGKNFIDISDPEIKIDDSGTQYYYVTFDLEPIVITQYR